MIDRVKLTKQEVLATETYKEGTGVQKRIYAMPHYVKSFGGYLTIGKIKGKKAMMNLHHLDEFGKQLLEELSYKIE